MHIKFKILMLYLGDLQNRFIWTSFVQLWCQLCQNNKKIGVLLLFFLLSNDLYNWHLYVIFTGVLFCITVSLCSISLSTFVCMIFSWLNNHTCILTNVLEQWKVHKLKFKLWKYWPIVLRVIYLLAYVQLLSCVQLCGYKDCSPPGSSP